jgi:hypothetical protein
MTYPKNEKYEEEGELEKQKNEKCIKFNSPPKKINYSPV